MLMCNKGIPCVSRLKNHPVDHQQSHQSSYLMDIPPATALTSASGSMLVSDSGAANEESRRVKFLCSFLGNIMPRPQDGKLRYVGGETRIVSVPRDISYEELISKMRELYEGAAILKYQQPDEDLDALVSVVNDDDVINMMEEYDKLGSGDGFTRLRIFLFSHPDHDGSSSSPYVDMDERDTERRYVDALNNLNDTCDFKLQHQLESPVMSPVEDIHLAEPFFNQISADGGLLNQRSSEIPLPQYNMHHLTISPMGSGQHQLPVTQRYNEMEAPWSPAYFSPSSRHHGRAHHDPRSMADFPSSPSATRYRMPFAELPDKCMDRLPEEYTRQQVNHQPVYDHQHQYSENVIWLPTGAIPSEKTGFPGNILHGPSVVDGSNICEHCLTSYQRSQPQSEHPSIGNGLPQVANPCAECPSSRDTLMLKTDAKLPVMYPNEQNNDHRPIHSDAQNHDRGWFIPNPMNVRVDEARQHISGSGRLNDRYIGNGTGINFPLGHGNLADGHHVSSNYSHHRPGPEMGTEDFHDKNVAAPPHVHIPSPEECGMRYGNSPYAYGGDNHFSVSHAHVPGHALWKNAPTPVHIGPSYEACGPAQQVNGNVSPGLMRGEGNPRLLTGADTQNSWADASKKMLGYNGTSITEFPYANALNLNANMLAPNDQQPVTLDPVCPPPDKLNLPTCFEPVQTPELSSNVVHNKEVSLTTSGAKAGSICDTDVNKSVKLEKRFIGEEKKEKSVGCFENSNGKNNLFLAQNKNSQNDSDAALPLEYRNSNHINTAAEGGDVEKLSVRDPSAPAENSISGKHFSFLPELIASVKRAAIEGVEEVKARVEEQDDSGWHDLVAKEATKDELESVDLDHHNDNLNTFKIEPTKAEAEAIARGLQTIKNVDLEEIRELGSGTYGAVYHGKWKGSDVAIKRIKASCFAGKPSERARLIADFWKEALILSSLHHPNVVSFYGIVRDGPDGSLATVTEFMVNGSLKQFLQKKDRTIDRRKRLIIAMDAAFGMEYLHGKNIVHFDLKCENLLVNMRDPQRPVCKIGDLGLSKVKQHTLVSGGVRGTLPWMAPELLSGKSNMVSEKIDVYSFGIVMWELLTGDEPYADMHCASIIGGIVNNTLRPEIPTWCDPEWKSLMEKCWASDPAERPSFSEISQKLRSMAAAMNVK